MALQRRHILRTTPTLAGMDQSMQDFSQSLAAQNSIDTVWSTATSAAQALGMDFVIYMYLRPTAPADSPLVLANMPQWWGDYYLEEDLAARDPFFKTCQSFSLRCTGREYLPENEDMLTSGEVSFVKEAGETGLLSGFASPVRLANPGHFGGWHFGANMKRNTFQNLFETQAERLQLMGFLAHEQLQHELRKATTLATGASKPGVKTNPSTSLLSEREKECLLWLAKGLRTSQIADHLGLATVTIDLHFKRARQKLGAATREEALAKAIIGGEINL